jgi:class 3 adenylate cyclase/tetratricopeptide (TPR) repeat protein
MIGKTISHYRILEKLGEGGMGVVYKAHDTKLDRLVALKFLPPDLIRDDEAKERFIYEAKAASTLQHNNICTIHDIDEMPDGQIFIVMDCYDGETLKEKIRRGPLQIEEVIDISMQIAQGLDEAHTHKIIHRDIKPANILITHNGIAKIVDFGLAKLLGRTELIKTGSKAGTAAYMSPEQYRGEGVDHQTDIWSLGVMLYEMLTAQLPFLHEYEAAIVYSILNESPPLLTEMRENIPVELEKVVLKCLRKDPKDRYPSAQQILTDLKKLKKTLRDKKREPTAYRREKPEVKKETERRQATVIFAEISGYTEMLNSMDEEEVAAIMSHCLEIFGTIVEKYGGCIEKIMDNSFMVLFGVPVAIEDAPKEAINAAIEIRNQLSNLNHDEKLPIPLDIHIGINTGMLISGIMGSDEKKEHTVMGDTVILANQLKNLSAKAQICVGPLTYKYTKDDFEYEALKPLILKGRKEPIAAFKLLSFQERVHRARLGAERMIYSEMVGREKELDKLKLHMLKAINGQGSIVNVIGEAGIGKSRLVAELSKREEMRKVTLLRGRALSIGANLSFHPIIDILRGWAWIKEEDPPATSAQKLEKIIRRVYPEKVSEIFPFIATLMGLKLTGKHAERLKGIEGDALVKLILKNVRELIIKASSISPLLFILEDLHWADLTSIDLLESLYRLAVSNSILFINVMRPDYETSERLLRTIRNRYPDDFADIYLEPLDNSQCEILIGNLLNIEALPIHVRDLIARRAEGNPFFIEEVARSFIDDGVVEIKEGRFRVTDKIDSVDIPESINDVIMARVDKLDEQTKSLLKVASVIGRYFFYKILAEVARSVEEIDDRLEHLKEVQLIKERQRMKELEYLFKHALARDAVYNSIPVKKRKQLHLDVARAVESIFCERLSEFYGMLAFHYSRGEVMEKAEEYLLKAGEEALKAAASNEALNYFQDTMKLYLSKFGETADPEKIASLHKNIGKALYFKGHFAESIEHFDKALEHWGFTSPKSEFKARLKLLVELLWMMKEIHFPSQKRKRTPGKKENNIMETCYRKQTALISIDTHKMFTEAIGLFRRMGQFDLTEIEHGLAFLSGFSALFSYSGVSLRIGRKILDYFKPYLDKCDDRTLFAYNFWKLVCDYLSGDWSEKLDLDKALIDTMILKGEIYNATTYTGILAFIKTELGDFPTAQKCCDKFQEFAETYEDDYHKARRTLYFTKLLLRSGRLDDVLRETEKMVPYNQKIGQRLAVIYLLGIRANAQFLLNDIDSAESSLRQAQELVSHEKRISPLMISTYLSSQFMLYLYKFEKALSSSDQTKIRQLRKDTYNFGAAALKNSMRFAAEKTKVFRLMGSYFWLKGKQEKAFRWWERSVQEGEKLKARPELSQTYLEIGKKMLEEKSRIHQRNGLKAEDYLEKARHLFMDLKIESDMEELDSILNQRKRDIDSARTY